MGFRYFLTFFVLAIAVGCTSQSDYNHKKGYAVGDVASDFELKNVDGKMVTLASYEGAKGYIVVFTCNHCPYAVMYEDRLNALHEKYSERGYPIVAINPNDPEVKPMDSYENMIVRAKEKNFKFAYLYDDGQKVFPLFGATKTPHVYLLDSDKKVRYIGAIDDNPRNEDGVEVRYLDDAIEAIDQGNDPDPTTTKAIGCSIKVKS